MSAFNRPSAPGDGQKWRRPLVNRTGNPKRRQRPLAPLSPSLCLLLMEMTRSHTGDSLITCSLPTSAPITRLMQSFMWSFGSIPSAQTLSGSGLAPLSTFTPSLLHLRSICSSNYDFMRLRREGGNQEQE